jgi:TorA maturation chaperone TorD
MMDAGAGNPVAAAVDSTLIAPEDSARASFYALIGRLFYAPPDTDLIRQIAASRNTEGESAVVQDGSASDLARAWLAMQAGCAKSNPELAGQEHEALFIGIGKAPVTPYTSGYASPITPDRHLVQLRQQLGEWGLARQDAVFDSEDHVSGLCDVMRYLIETNQSVDMQKQFFETYVQTGAVPFCDAVIHNGNAVFYRQVAVLAKAFFEVEKAAFDMLAPGC